ncbi:MAG: hypothetical protein COB35_05090 [Gammaproteobacteria bacterium]|nr:MAG: hypothetical protein COB35_05090 [Gammaproteobacteria bacterium]
MNTQGIKVSGYECRFWQRTKHPNSVDWWHWTPKDWINGETVINSSAVASLSSGLNVDAKSVDINGKLSILFSGGNEGKHIIDLTIETSTRKLSTSIGLIVTDKK